MNEGDKDKFVSYVIECLVSDYNFHPNKAREAVAESAFIVMLDIDPEFVGHYNVEYWAEKVKKQYDYGEAKREAKDLGKV